MAPKKNKGKEKEPTPPASPTSSSSTTPSIRREIAGEEDDSDPEIHNWFQGDDRENAVLKEVVPPELVPPMVSVRAKEIRTKRRFDRPEQYNLNIQSPESLPARTKGGQKLTAKHRKEKEQEAAAAKAAAKDARAAAAERWSQDMGVPSTGTSGVEGNSIRGVSSGGGAGRGGASRKQARAAPATEIEQEEEEPVDQEEDNVNKKNKDHLKFKMIAGHDDEKPPGTPNDGGELLFGYKCSWAQSIYCAEDHVEAIRILKPVSSHVWHFDYLTEFNRESDGICRNTGISTRVLSATFTVINKCNQTVWLLLQYLLLTQQDFHYRKMNRLPSPWTGRLWGITNCGQNSTGSFSCISGDCGSGKVECSGGQSGKPPPGPLGLEFYGVSFVDGFSWWYRKVGIVL